MVILVQTPFDTVLVNSTVLVPSKTTQLPFEAAYMPNVEPASMVTALVLVHSGP